MDRGEGGCIVDPDRPDWGLLVQEGLPLGKLVLRRAPRFAPEVLDTNVEMHDCLQAAVLGERGIFVVQRMAQVRFYTRPESKGARWPYREVYSIYTPSRQGGLLMMKLGLLVGNYWLRVAPEWGPAWREFAINTWHEETESANMRMALDGDDAIVAQGHREEGRLSRFTPPADPTQLWNELRMGENLKLRFPHALAASGGDVVVGENAGPGSRLFLFRGRAAPVQLTTTNGTHTAFIVDGRVLAVGADGPAWYDLQPRR